MQRHPSVENRRNIHTYWPKASLISFIFFGLVLINEFVLDWPMLRLWNIYSSIGFIDLHAILGHVECYRDGTPLTELRKSYSLENTGCYGYWYGDLFLILGKYLGLSKNFTQALALAGIFILILILVSNFLGIHQKSNKTDKIMLVGVLISPPIILLFQRGNLDLFMALGLWIAAKLTSRGSGGAILAWLLLSITTLVKFWTFPALILAIFWIRNRSLQIIIFFLSILQGLVIVSQFRKVDFGAFEPTTQNLYGFKAFSTAIQETVTYNISALHSWVIDIVVFVACLVLAGLIYRYSSSNMNKNTGDLTSKDPSFWFFGSCILFTYFAGMNVDYRLVVVVLLASSIGAYSSGGLPIRVTIALALICTWLSYPSGGLQLLGDLAAGVIVALWATYALFFSFDKITNKSNK